MNTSDSLAALRRANPRAKADFVHSVQAAAGAVHERIATDPAAPARRAGGPQAWGRLAGVSAAAGATLAAAAFVAVVVAGSPSGGPGVENAVAAVRKAATVTAASADRSGTAVVRITHNGELWAAKTIRWNGGDLAVASDAPRRRGHAASPLLVVDGTLYSFEAAHGWVALGSPDNVDPGSGTTPDEYLAAVREDVGGATLRRIGGAMSGLTTRRFADGSTVYSGTIAAGSIARDTGFKEGRSIRVLPFGDVAHDEAADPAASLGVAITVGAGGVVREIAVSWGRGGSAWAYTVTYSSLGSTPALVAPANAKSLRELRGL